VHENRAWTIERFDAAKDLKLTEDKTGKALNAADANLKPYLDRGGKLVMYHGWNDPGVPALNTITYFDAVRASVGAKAEDEAVRLYMVPGMQHCGGGPGATEFGHDMFTAMEQWVEAAKAPGTIVAKKTNAKTKTVEFTRPLCVYPAVAKYVKGDTNDAQSFACVLGSK
jgi:hypothetical protein